MRLKGFISGILFFVVTIIGIFGIYGCGQGEEEEKKETVKIAYLNWSEGIAMTHLVAVILEEEMDYTVKTQLADVAPVYASIAQEDQDFFLDAWLPVTHQDYMDKYQDRLVDLGVNFDKARLGLVVPRYVEVNAIPDLKNHPEQFDKEIIGIDYGAGIMSRTEKMIEEYGLDYNLVSSSGPAMTAGLKEAIDTKTPIVITGWMPHWMFTRFDLKFLDDPKKVYGTEEKIHTVARKGFKEDMPEVTAFLKRFKMNEEHLLTLMDDIYRSDEDPRNVARKWYNNHKDVVEAWLPENQPAK